MPTQVRFQGTLPFMSGEILQKEAYFFQLPGETSLKAAQRFEALGPITHDAVHDLESFFWVLMWLCMSRGAPSRRRDELQAQPDGSVSTRNLRALFHKHFESEDVEKIGILRDSFWKDGLRNGILLTNFTAYCMPLQTLADQFFSILQAAYSSRNFEKLHEDVIKCFDASLAGLHQNPPKYSAELLSKIETAQRDEDERRRNDLGVWNWTSPKGQKNGAPEDSAGSPKPKRARLQGATAGDDDEDSDEEEGAPRNITKRLFE